MDIENLYNTVKSLIPFADQFLPQGAMRDNINEIKKIIEVIDNAGGITAITQLLNINKVSPQQNVDSLNNKTNDIETYEKICDLE